MMINKNIKLCKTEMEKYEKEIQKLEKQKMEYLEVDKVPPKRITRRIIECEIIYEYYWNFNRKMEDLENKYMIAKKNKDEIAKRIILNEEEI